MTRLLNYFIERSFVVNLIAGFICLVGVVTLSFMKRDLIPPFEFQMIQAQILLPGATPEEMEKFVVFPIEETLKGIPGLEKIESSSRSGSSEINLMFEPSFDKMMEATETVRSRIEAQRGRLPQSIRHINVERVRVNEVFFFILALEHFDEENSNHRLHMKNLEQKLNQVQGVVRTENHSRSRDVYIDFYPQKLKNLDISVTQARKAVLDSLRLTPIGQVLDNEDRFSVELSKADSSIESIRELPVSANLRGDVVKLSEIAEVHYRLADQLRLVSYNGSQTVTLTVYKDTLSDTIRLKEKGLKVIEDFNQTLPAPLKVTLIADGPAFIEKQIEVLSKNGLLGLILVLLILMLFLNWKTSVLTVLGLPVAYLGTMVILHSMGIAIDLISIIGMILVVGILVDDAIIVSERYIENLEEGLPPKQAALEAVRVLIIPVTGTILTTIVAFLPMVLIKSEISAVLAAVPLVIIFSLLLSWFESFFILPNHLAHFVSAKDRTQPAPWFLRVRRGYERVLRFTLKGRYALVVTLIVAFGASGFWAAKKLRHDFNLSVGMERVTVYAILKNSPSLEATHTTVAPLEALMLELPKPDVETVFTRTGSIWMDGRSHDGYRFSRIDLYLDKHSPYPNKLKTKVSDLVEEKIKALREAPDSPYEKLYVNSTIESKDSDKSSMVTVQVKGGEEVDFRKIEDTLSAVVLKVEGVTEAIIDPERYRTAWEFSPDTKALMQHNLTPFELAAQLRGLFVPDELLETRIAGERVYLYTQTLREKVPHFSQLSKLSVLTNRGVTVPLSYLGQWTQKSSLNKIQHLNGRRELKMDYKFDEKIVNSLTLKENLKTAILDVQKAYPSYDIKVVDSNEEEAKNRAWALKVALIAISAVLLILSLILGSLTQPFLVGLPIPFGIIGIIWALYLHNMPLGLMAIIGLVGIVGISVNDSLIMVDHMNHLAKKSGKALSRETIILGASSRLRAILLTTITTLGGVFPMAYSFGGESGFTQPLAFSMGWGLSFSTILTLFALPALMEIRNDILHFGQLLLSKWAGRKLKTVLAPLSPVVDATTSMTDKDQPQWSSMADWDWDESDERTIDLKEPSHSQPPTKRDHSNLFH